MSGGDVTKTPAFKAWFDGSKVVDHIDGTPLVVYHGARETFSVFDPDAQKERATWAGFGSWFTADYRYAEAFASSGARKVVSVYLSIKKPMRLRGDGAQGFAKLTALYQKVTGLKTFEAGVASNRRFRAYLKKQGYDGIHLTNFTGDAGLVPGAQTFFVALDPTQVKSVHNGGTFDPKNPDMFMGLHTR